MHTNALVFFCPRTSKFTSKLLGKTEILAVLRIPRVSCVFGKKRYAFCKKEIHESSNIIFRNKCMILKNVSFVYALYPFVSGHYK